MTTLMRRLPASPKAVMMTVFSITALFVLARLVVAGEGNISRFVVAGSTFTDPLDPPPIHIVSNEGYDGQFYWRLAADPTDLRLEFSNGVRLDQPLRASRILYPTLSWLLAAGHKEWIKWSLIVVNIVGMGAAAYFASLRAASAGQRAIVGLLAVSASGLVMSVSRDLTEVAMVACLMAGAHLLHQGRHVLAGVSWAGALLAHDQSLYVLIGFAAWLGFSSMRNRSLNGRPWITAAIPAVAFAAWQAIARTQLGVFPVLDSRNQSVGIPGVDLGSAILDWVRGGFLDNKVLLPQLVALVSIVWCAWKRRGLIAANDQWMLFSCGSALLGSLSLSKNVWVGPADLRQVVLVAVLSSLIVISSGKPPGRWVTLAVPGVWILTAGFRVVAI